MWRNSGIIDEDTNAIKMNENTILISGVVSHVIFLFFMNKCSRTDREHLRAGENMKVIRDEQQFSKLLP